MKNKFPLYKAGQLIKIKEKLKPKDQQILKDFLVYCGGTAGKQKLATYERYMIQLRDVTEIPYSGWNLKKLREFLALLKLSPKSPATKNDIKKVTKRFLMEEYNDYNTRFNRFKDIFYEDERNHDKLNQDTILNKEEVEKVIRMAESLKWKAMIMLMFESGGRTEEILNLKWKDINLEKKTVKLKSNKTGKTRVNPLDESIIHLERYKREYLFTDLSAEDFIFPSPNNREQHISNAMVLVYYRRVGKRAVNKHLFPYLLRHSRLTPLIQELSPKAYEKFAGHSLETGMKYYGHLSSEKLDREILQKIYHVEEITKEDSKKIKFILKRLEVLEEILPIEVIKKLEKENNKDFLKAYIEVRKEQEKRYKIS